MKKVKFDGRDWILITENGGFFNPNPEVYFYSDEQGRIATIVKSIHPEIISNKVYEIPDNGIYTAVCGPKCGPFWPDANCNHCGGNGVGATFSDSEMQMGGTDEANQEVENIMQGKSNIHPELNR